MFIIAPQPGDFEILLRRSIILACDLTATMIPSDRERSLIAGTEAWGIGFWEFPKSENASKIYYLNNDQLMKNLSLSRIILETSSTISYVMWSRA